MTLYGLTLYKLTLCELALYELILCGLTLSDLTLYGLTLCELTLYELTVSELTLTEQSRTGNDYTFLLGSFISVDIYCAGQKQKKRKTGTVRVLQ